MLVKHNYYYMSYHNEDTETINGAVGELFSHKKTILHKAICSWHLIPLGSLAKQLQMKCLGIKFITLLDIKMATKNGSQNKATK